MKHRLFLLVILACVLVGCKSAPNTSTYVLINDGQKIILNGMDYGWCSADAVMNKLEIACNKDYKVTYVTLADSFEVIKDEEVNK